MYGGPEVVSGCVYYGAAIAMASKGFHIRPGIHGDAI